VEHPADGEVAALRLFHFARRCLGFLRSVAILLQMYGAALPAWWLIGVSTLELFLMVCARRALAEWVNARWSMVLLVAAFLFTHGAGVGCLARPGGCGDLAGLGVALIALNVGLLGWLAARPCRGACAALAAPDAADDGPATPPIVRSSRGLGKRYVNFCCKLSAPETDVDNYAA
jgi:hypothetical protein